MVTQRMTAILEYDNIGTPAVHILPSSGTQLAQIIMASSQQRDDISVVTTLSI